MFNVRATTIAFLCGILHLSGQTVKLPKPSPKGGMPLMEALSKRATGRTFSPKVLTPEHLGGLLWAALGVNRPDGKRTAPTARNWQEITLYVTQKDGVFRYDATDHSLVKIKGDDIREATGKQPFVAQAPVNLVFVAEDDKMASDLRTEKKIYYGAIDTGFVSQNVYLYCASEGLSTVVRAHLDAEKLHKLMGLKATHRVVAAQSVGYPK